jgi:predicted double-glycine peptidase
MLSTQTLTTKCGVVASLLLLSLLVPIVTAAGAEQRIPFRSWTTLRTQGVVLQRLDFSCGAASIATISTFFLGKPITEEQVMRIIRARYSDEEWKKKKKDGLSMEDLSYMAEQLGFKAQGARIGLAGLLKLDGPVIVHLNKGEFQHFTVLRGIHGMTVYLADPFFGSVPMSLGTFVEQFTGAALAVWDPAKSLSAEYTLKLGKRDTYHDEAYSVIRPSLYDRLRPLRPAL